MTDKIITSCSECRVKLRISRESAGRRRRCPKCGEVFEVKLHGSGTTVLQRAATTDTANTSRSRTEKSTPERRAAKRPLRRSGPKAKRKSRNRLPLIAVGVLFAVVAVVGFSVFFHENNAVNADSAVAGSATDSRDVSSTVEPNVADVDSISISDENPFEDADLVTSELPSAQTGQQKNTSTSAQLPVTLTSVPAPAPGDISVVVPRTSNSNDWLQFRGADFNRTSDTSLPTQWSATDNVDWKCDLPGMGTSSPIVVGNKIFLTTYTDFGQQKENPGDWQNMNRNVICIDRQSGNILWTKSIRAENKPHNFQGFLHLHGYASHSLTSDGQRIYAHLGNSGAFAFDPDGTQLWHTPVGTGVSGFGSGASPAIYGDVVLVNASIESRRLLALNKADGSVKWKAEVQDSYAIPVVAWVKDHHEIIVPAKGESVIGINADTGEKLWKWAGQKSSRYICTSPILHDGVIYATGSVDGPLAAIRPGGRGDVSADEIWRGTNFQSDCSSPVFHDGRVYWVRDDRYAIFDAASGDILKQGRHRVRGGFYATPLVAGDRMYLAARQQGVVVVKMDDDLTVIAENNVEERSEFSVNASPVPHNGQLLIRTNRALYCIGAK